MAGLAQRAAKSKTRSWGSARVLDAKKFLLILGIFCTENCGSSEQFSCALGAVGPRHAEKTGIGHKGFLDYGLGDASIGERFADKGIVLWSREIKRAKDLIYLGPDQNKAVAPIVFREHYYDSEDFVYENHAIKETKRKFLLVKSKSSLSGRRILDLEALHGVTGKEILEGLEKAISKILQGEEK